MADLIVTSSDGLIQTTVRQKRETYYLVTADNLNSLKSKSILADIFVFISSLAWGAYFSIITTIKSIPEPKTQDDPVNKILLPLMAIENVVLWAGIIFILLTSWMFYQSCVQIKEIKTSGHVNLEPGQQQ